MDFENILDDLEIAAEAISVSDYKSAAKAAKLATKAATKLMKAGDYDGAIAKCDEAIASIKSVKAQLNTDDRGEGRGEEGEGGQASRKGGVVKAIVVSILAALTAAAAVVAAQKFGGKVATSKHLTGAQAKVNNIGVRARNKADTVKMDHHNKTAEDMRNGDFEKIAKVAQKADMAETRLMYSRGASAEDYANKNKAISDKISASGKKGVAAAAGAVGVGAGVIQALKAFVGNKKYTPEAMDKALDMCIKSLEGIKASCNEAKRGRASESVIAFFGGVSEALLATGNESVIMDLLDCGMDDLMACEMYVNFVVPAVVAYETYGDAEDDYEDYDEYFDEGEN